MKYFINLQTSKHFFTMAYLTAEKKEEIFGQYGKSNKDTGSPESQIALFSYRISHLTEHLKSNRHDFGTQRALLRLVGQRRQLLEYLKEVDIERYRAIIKTLNLRKQYEEENGGSIVLPSFSLFAIIFLDELYLTNYGKQVVQRCTEVHPTGGWTRDYD